MRYNLFDMLPEQAFQRDASGKIKPQGGGGTTSTPTSQTVTNTSIPEYAQPYVESTLGKAAALTDINQNPYQPYTGQQIAGFTPMQTQAMGSIAGQQTAPQLADASNLAYQSGMGGLGAYDSSAALQNASLGYGAQGAGIGGQGWQNAQGVSDAGGLQASMYGGLGAGYGQQGMQSGAAGQNLGVQGGGMYGTQGAGMGLTGAGLGITGGAEYGGMGAGYGANAANMAGMGYSAGARYAGQATNPYAVDAYMSPYMQDVVDVQKREANRNYDISKQQVQGQGVAAGAFGGSRDALMRAENERNRNTALNQIQAAGSQAAYDKAIQSMQYGAGLGLQGLQAGTAAQQAGIQGAGMGLQGVNTQLAGTAQGIQGAQTGLQGVNTQLAGTSQGMQGAGVGISGAQTGLSGVGQQINAGQLGLSGANAALAGNAQGMQGVQGAVGAGQYGLQGLGTAGTAASTLGALGQTQFGQDQAISQAQLAAGAQQQALQQQGLNTAYQQYQTNLNYPYQQLGFMSDLLRGLPLSQSASTMYQATPPASQQLMGLGLGAAGLSKAFA